MPRKRREAGDPLIAVAYLRVSTEDQALGPDAQRVAIEAWAARGGVSVASWHVDQGVSGGAPLEECPALQEAITALRPASAGVLVAAKRDRLGRQVERVRQLEAVVLHAGAVVRTADGMSDQEGSSGMLARVMLDGIAEYERVVIGERTKAALAVKRARGERVGALPYGFQLAEDGIHLEPCPTEAETIERALALRVAGLNPRQIGEALAKEGLVSRAERPLSRVQVLRILAASHTWIVYRLKDPRTGAVRYVGCTIQTLPQRLAGHLADGAHPDRGPRHAWLATLRAIDTPPIIETIETVRGDAEEALRVEQRQIHALLAEGVDLLNVPHRIKPSRREVATTALRYCVEAHRLARQAFEKGMLNYAERILRAAGSHWTERQRLIEEARRPL
jgi:DNA invertase Pin-like site-specific DNA recombinase